MLPPGCHIRLDRTTQDRVLRNVRDAIPSSYRALVDELRRMQAGGTPVTLLAFLQESGIELGDVYNNRSFTILKHAAGLEPLEVPVSKRIGSFIHVDDRRRIDEYRRCLTDSSGAHAFERMLAFPLTRSVSLDGLNQQVQEEMLELLSVLESRAAHRPQVSADLPFALHCHYSRDEIVAPFRDNPESMRQGTFYVEEFGLDVHIVTLCKSERHFSPSNRYADYFRSPDLLYWESQSTTTAHSPTGQRLINGLGRHLFFVREGKFEDGRTSPFNCLGYGKPISSEGERPIKLIWKLDHVVPDHTYMRFLAAAG
jgi:hypothetical protein